MAKDWHREDIRAAIRKSGITLAALSKQHGFHFSAVTTALGRRWPTMERVIASHLGREPQDIWPSRYHPDGTPRKLSSGRKARHVKNAAGA